MPKIYLSVIIPIFNEESNVWKLHEELIEVLKRTGKKCEIIYVDDASSDKSVDNLVAAIKKIPRNENIFSRLILLRRNFGQTAATSAGIDCARGEVVAFLDADLQNDPADLQPMLHKLNTGFDAVVGWRKDRHDSSLRVFLSNAANFLVRIVFHTPFRDLGCSLKVIRRDFLRDTRIYGESHRLISILLFWKGASIAQVEVNHRKRISGKSKYGYSRMIKLILDLVTAKFLSSYGTKPAYVFGTFGIFSIFVSIPLMGIVLYHKFYLGVFVHRNPLFLIAIFLILLGIQFLLMGLLAELIVRTYFETQKKTTYEIKSTKVY